MKSNANQIHTHISASHKWFDLKLDEVWRYRDLIILFTKRSFAVSYKQTILGPLWLFINPFLTSIVYTILFGNIAKLSTDGLPQILFYLASNALWSLFSVCLTNNASTFTGNAGLFGKIYFPRLTVPISNVFTAIIRFGITMSMVLVILAFYCITGAVSPNWIYWLLIPFILIWIGALGMECGIIISSMTTKYRDLSVLVSFGVSLWMYATPVVYPLSQLPEGTLKTIIEINPVSAPIELFRFAVLGKGTIVPWSIALSAGFTAIVGLLAIVVFNKVERSFIDTV
jgi:lipopolysaccharide transport system permease protein